MRSDATAADALEVSQSGPVAAAQVVLLGVGSVGTALLQRWHSRASASGETRWPQLIAVANSRALVAAEPDEDPAQLQARLRVDPSECARVEFQHIARADVAGTPPSPARAASAHVAGAQVGSIRSTCVPRFGARELLKPDPTARLRDADADIDSLPDRFDPRRIRIVVDASGSEALALRHPAWLAQGIHVVTASKRGQGASLARWRAIDRAAIAGATRYGDSATVGAGLPLLRTLRALRAGGDRIHAIAGILSGSLAWLLSQYDGSRAFSALIREARERGLTEPDPRDDLTGTDVRRKLLILARAAGHALEEADVATQALLTSALALLPPREALDALELLDGALHARWLQARREGRVLRHVARFDPRAAGASSGVASVGIEALAPDDPLTQSTGCDNRVAIWSDRYPTSPLVIQGPGAGADVTAAALLDDIVEICGGVVGASVGIR